MTQILTWGKFDGGLSDNHILGNDNQTTDMQNIDIHTNVMGVGLSYMFELSRYMTQIWRQESRVASSEYDVEAIRGVVSTGNIVNIFGNIYKNNIRIGKIPHGIYRHIVVAQHYKDSPAKNYFFGDDKIYITDAFLDNITTVKEISYDRKQQPLGPVLQVGNSVIFSIGIDFYELNIESDMIQPYKVVKDIQAGSTIVGLHYYNNDLYIFTRTALGTDIYRMTYGGESGIYEITYKHSINGSQVLSVTGNNHEMYWVCNNGIYITIGDQSYRHKTIDLGNNARIGFLDDILLVAGRNGTYKYQNIYNGGNRVLSNIFEKPFRTLIGNGSFFDEDGIIWNISTKNHTNEGYIVSNTLHGDISLEKEVRGISIVYSLKYATNETPDKDMKIDVYITKDIEEKNPKWIHIDEINDEKNRIRYIPHEKIAQALDNEGESTKFVAMKLKIVLHAGGKFRTREADIGGYDSRPIFYEAKIHINTLNYERA